MFYEGARFHQQRFKEYGTRLADLADLVRMAFQISEGRYDEAKRLYRGVQGPSGEFVQGHTGILVPAATGPAPLGLSSTGDSEMNAPWTALGTPAISNSPASSGAGCRWGYNSPQTHGQDARVLQTASICTQSLPAHVEQACPDCL